MVFCNDITNNNFSQYVGAKGSIYYDFLLYVSGGKFAPIFGRFLALRGKTEYGGNLGSILGHFCRLSGKNEHIKNFGYMALPGTHKVTKICPVLKAHRWPAVAVGGRWPALSPKICAKPGLSLDLDLEPGNPGTLTRR